MEPQTIVRSLLIIGFCGLIGGFVFGIVEAEWLLVGAIVGILIGGGIAFLMIVFENS